LDIIRNKYKIVHVVRQFSPAIGGLESFVKSLAKEQIKAGLDVEVVTLNRVFHKNNKKYLAESEIIEGIKVTRIPYIGSHKYPFAPDIIKKITTADIVHVHAIDFFSDFLSLSKFIHRKALVLSTHGGFFHTKYASLFKRVFFNLVTRYTIKNYLAVAACSESDLLTFKKIRKNKIFLVENGVDVTKFGSSVTKVPNKRLVFLGRFSKNKRIDQLLLFFSKLISTSDEYHLLIIGKDWDDSLKQMELIIQDLNISEHVTILPELDDSEIKVQLDNASFIVSASEYEGFGLSIIEGMSAGLIPLCSNIPSFTKIIEKSGVGINLDFFDMRQVQTVDAFINTQLGKYTDIANKARSAAKAYSWPIKALEFTEIYDVIIGDKYRDIQGLKVDNRRGTEVVEHIDSQINLNKKVMLAFVNAHTINIANKDHEFKEMLGSFLVLNDGIGLQIASKLKYHKGFIENLNGTDFVPKYLASSKHQLKIFLLGATESVVTKTFDTWSHEYRRHKWCGYHNGFIDNHCNHFLVEKINNSGADTLIVAMGNPLQEKWIYKNRELLNIKLAIGVGALFDFTAGNVSRAPNLMQQLKIEWLYRLALEPKRLWRRYIIGNVIFLWNAIND